MTSEDEAALKAALDAMFADFVDNRRRANQQSGFVSDKPSETRVLCEGIFEGPRFDVHCKTCGKQIYEGFANKDGDCYCMDHGKLGPRASLIQLPK